MMSWSRRTWALLAAIPVGLLVLTFLVFPGDGSRTVTAHFDRAVAVYPGTDLRVMGVKVGTVTDVVPDGNSVRVEMTYDAEYSLPDDAKAAVVTPTLVADRYVQVFPAYAKGKPAMPDDGDIPLERTQTPIELDRMFKSLDDLAVTLGPKAGSTKGALDNLLTAGAKALDGNGALGSKTIRNLSSAAEVFANNRGPLFDNVRALAEITDTLAANDTTVDAFVKDLTSVSDQFAGERDELRQVLGSLADVLGVVEGFVKENRSTLGKDVRLLGSLVDRVDQQKDALGLVAQKGALALGNLALSFESGTGTFGSRVQLAPGITMRPDQILCQSLENFDVPEGVCSLISNLLQPLLPATSGTSGAAKAAKAPATPTPADVLASTPDVKDGPLSLLGLLGGGRS